MVDAEPGATSVTAVSADELQVLHRRTLNALRLAQVPGQAAVASSVAVVTLLASDLLGSDRLAGLGERGVHDWARPSPRSRCRPTCGGMVVAPGSSPRSSSDRWVRSWPARAGRCAWFPLFVFGMMLFGAGQSATLQSRYVGADLATPEQRAKSIAAIVWVGTLGAVFGPIFTPFEKDFARLVGLDELVGPYVFGAHLVPGERGGDVHVPAP